MEMASIHQFLALEPPFAVSWVSYIIIGGIAGWLAGKLVKGEGQGIVMNIVIGVIGGVIGGFVLNWFGFNVEAGRRWFTFFTSLLGAMILLWIVRLVRKLVG
ncbi:GlsB/YeaQ/YmgE family stress response membrane protein [Mycolicibacterium phocaicum]|uniref:GlsB/YeaQ/YmgE family stress response membrane protein n=1 Tax=Mycolicibacterium phocaicum TaxID=319706 RepID=A0A7I7ZHQ9_9MYCO|nr:GlsB/YeaQ/YmgE family stress response membrane protein [Mycolicibacterium phocaicum]TLH67529.1 GlsB/YeaQ/YmgE family stress response membrane protein [Mycolicibacterium phocaicum]BBZ53570.1 membrane protein [Mycolicibacterium phocaicum]